MKTAFLLSIIAGCYTVIVSAKAVVSFDPLCRDVQCPHSNCALSQQIRLPGDCCPICRPKECEDIYCVAVACQSGERQVYLPGDCCPSCEKALYEKDLEAASKQDSEYQRPEGCEDIYCAAVACQSGERQVYLPGDCCPSCEKVLYEKDLEAASKQENCIGVVCHPPPYCAGRQKTTYSPGACCPIHVCTQVQVMRVPATERCKNIKCIQVACKPGQQKVTPPGECCPACVGSESSEEPAKDKEAQIEADPCSGVKCPPPPTYCAGMQRLSLGACCPTYVCGYPIDIKRCFDTHCLHVACEPGQVQVTPKGECCPKCVGQPAEEAMEASNEPVDCIDVECPPIECRPEITPFIPPGECCPVCLPTFQGAAAVETNTDCAVNCPAGYGCATDRTTGVHYCMLKK